MAKLLRDLVTYFGNGRDPQRGDMLDMMRAADEIDRLERELMKARDQLTEVVVAEQNARAELAKKDRRIEELERELHFHREGDKQDGLHIFTTEQINEAWDCIRTHPPATIFRILAIVACEKCGGTKFVDKRGYKARCDCPNNGWVIGGGEG